jgi:DNA polymerase (family 10)
MGGKVAGKGKRIPREAVQVIANKIEKKLGAEVFIGGSYCRGKADSGDVDLLVRGDREDFREPLVEMWGEQVNGDPARIGEVDGVQVDVSFADSEEAYEATKLMIIGSNKFNIAMRTVAKQKGYLLNQYGLHHRSTGELVDGVVTERDIFQALNLQYVEPSKRTGWDAIHKIKETSCGRR